MCSSKRLGPALALLLVGLAQPASAQFSDNFNRASLGPDWTVVDGTWDIASNQLRVQGAQTTARFIQYTANSSSSAIQYCGIRIQSVASSYYRLRFRENSSSGNHYQVELETGGTLSWYVRGATNSTIRAIGTSGWAAGDEFAITVTGTDTATTVYVYRNPPLSIPISASTWDGATTPLHTLTVTTPPASYADDGLGFGLGGRQSATGTLLFDDWRGGAVGASGGGGGTLRRLMTMGIGLLFWPWWW